MQKPLVTEYKAYFQKYIDLVPEGDFLRLWENNTAEAVKFFLSIPEPAQEFRYAEGKWTPKDILMHLSDTDRVMGYRALTGIRGDYQTPLYNMDENFYAAHVDTSVRSMESLVEEFHDVRRSLLPLFAYAGDTESSFLADAREYKISGRANAWIIMGHALHHIQVIRERYLQSFVAKK
jgi:hypothetical protein